MLTVWDTTVHVYPGVITSRSPATVSTMSQLLEGVIIYMDAISARLISTNVKPMNVQM